MEKIKEITDGFWFVWAWNGAGWGEDRVFIDFVSEHSWGAFTRAAEMASLMPETVFTVVCHAEEIPI